MKVELLRPISAATHRIRQALMENDWQKRPELEMEWRPLNDKDTEWLGKLKDSVSEAKQFYKTLPGGGKMLYWSFRLHDIGEGEAGSKPE